MFRKEMTVADSLLRPRGVILGWLGVLAAVFVLVGAGEVADAKGLVPDRAMETLTFIPNAGQVDPQVRFYARGRGYGFYFTPKGATLSLVSGTASTKEKGVALGLELLHTQRDVQPEGAEEQSGRVHYLVGQDPADWRTDLPTFEKVIYRNIWPEVDGAFKGEGGKLKYEFVVRPGGKAENIRFTYRGAESLRLDPEGNLRIQTALGELVDERPVAYQQVWNRRISVPVQLVLRSGPGGESICTFQTGDIPEPSLPLVIDPGLQYSTFLGGSGFDQPNAVAVDAGGHAYITGYTKSPDFPSTPGAFDPDFDGGGLGKQDAFITKLSADGRSLVYSTFFGNITGDTIATGIAVDDGGCAYVSGVTRATGLPATLGAFQTSIAGGQDFFALKLASTGSSLEYMTYLGGTGFEAWAEIVVDGSGNAHVSGYTRSQDFPTTSGAFQETFGGGEWDAYLSKLDSTGSNLLYSTYIGGTGRDNVWDAVLDTNGHVYLGGGTTSSDFPTTAGAYDEDHNGGDDAFLMKIDPDPPAGSPKSIYSTYLGTTGVEISPALALGGSGCVYASVFTTSASFPTTPGAFDESFNGGGGDAVVVKISSDGSSLLHSTFLGGTANDRAQAILVDAAGGVCLAGWTAGSFPTTEDAYLPDYQGGSLDGFLTKMDPSLSGLVYSSFLGGTGYESAEDLALDSGGSVYVTGPTQSADFPTTGGAVQPGIAGGQDGFVVKMDLPADSDWDGLLDHQETAIGTDPLDSDSDDDGLLDGTEVDSASGAGCPDPLDGDSDGDTLNDGSEVWTGTNPCNPDTDGDGLRDDIDPDPIHPPESDDALAQAMRAVADCITGLDLPLFTAPNDNARAGRRNSLANRLRNGATAAEEGAYMLAIDHLVSALDRVDGEEPPKDWMVDSDEKSTVAASLGTLIQLLEDRLGS